MQVNIGQGLLNALLYMGLPMIIIFFVGMYYWERTCRLKLKVIVIKSAGGSEVYYAAREGNDVTIENKALGVTRTWPINELVTFPVPYPEIGLLPRFLQRSIQTVILHEGDWEPVLNRSPHHRKVMSPDAVRFLQDLAEKHPESAEEITAYLDGVSTGPTRAMIADPAVLGALKKNAVMKALASASEEVVEALNSITRQLARFAGLNSTYVYIGLALVLIIQCINLYYQINNGPAASIADLSTKVDAISKALGIVGK